MAIELEYFNKDKHEYVRLLPDFGPTKSINFQIDEEVKLKVYVGVYPGCDCDVFVKPVIYKREKISA